MRRKRGAARGDAVISGDDELVNTRDSAETVETKGMKLVSSDGAFAETVKDPTSAAAPSEGQQCRAASGVRGFSQRSAQHFAARIPAALAVGAV